MQPVHLQWGNGLFTTCPHSPYFAGLLGINCIVVSQVHQTALERSSPINIVLLELTSQEKKLVPTTCFRKAPSICSQWYWKLENLRNMCPNPISD